MKTYPTSNIINFQTCLTNADDTESEPSVYTIQFDSSNSPRPPHDSFVISRNNGGEVLSRYGHDDWDLSPYKTAHKSNSKIIFTNWENKDARNTENISNEFKWIMFSLIYMGCGKRSGHLSVKTLYIYSGMLKSLCRFAYSEEVTIEQLLSNKNLLTEYCLSDISLCNVHSLIFVLSNFSNLGSNNTGIRVLDRQSIEGLRQLRQPPLNTHQTPLIPSRIYIGLLKTFHDIVDEFWIVRPLVLALASKALKDKYYGRSKLRQRTNGLSYRSAFHSEFNTALIEHDLVDYAKANNINELGRLSNHLATVQHTCKYIIHAYSGMRLNEAYSLRYNCLQRETTNSGRVIRLLGETSKLAGCRKTARWVVSECVEKAIETAQAIAEIIAKYKEVTLEECPLFISTAYLNFSSGVIRQNVEIACTEFNNHNDPLYRMSGSWSNGITLCEDDIKELEKNDPIRMWRQDEKFKIGRTWPLTTHQFRPCSSFRPPCMIYDLP
jgi:integrase